MRPFIFMVPFWGPVYRQYFVDRCLPSLLAPGNLPQLRAKDGHRLLIATTTVDWQVIEGLPILQEIRRYVTPVHLAVDTLAPTGAGSQSAIVQQNQCHKVLLEAAYSCRAYGCMLWPDVIFSDGLCRALLRWATEGYQLVLFASLRHVRSRCSKNCRSADFYLLMRGPRRPVRLWPSRRVSLPTFPSVICIPKYCLMSSGIRGFRSAPRMSMRRCRMGAASRCIRSMVNR